MQTYILKGIFIAALILSSDSIAERAFAVATKKSPEPASEQQAQVPPVVRKIELPISWQLTRTRLAGASSSTMTETYRENWSLEIQSSGVYFLRSPRAIVPAYVSEPTSDVEKIPESLTVSEVDFGRLIGVKQDDGESPTSLERPVTIPLTRKKRADSEILLTWSEDEHFVVQLDFSPQGFL